MTALSTIAGVFLIVVALRDIVHELFHPDVRGSVSRVVMDGTWAIMKAIGRRLPRALQHAGPTVIIAVASAWVVLISLGWALLYWPRLPTEFRVDASLPPAATHGFFTALYVSLSTMATLGASDLTPKVAGLRIITVLEGLVGLVMITAWITWVLSIQPVLAARRAFARRVALLQAAEARPERAVSATPTEMLAALLRSLTEDVVHIDADLRQSSVTYYFQQGSADATLSAQLPYVLALARLAEREKNEAVRYHGRLLRMAVETLVSELGARFLGIHEGRCEEILAGLAKDHLRDPAMAYRFDGSDR
jgi:hypothetical protein